MKRVNDFNDLDNHPLIFEINKCLPNFIFLWDQKGTLWRKELICFKGLFLHGFFYNQRIFQLSLSVKTWCYMPNNTIFCTAKYLCLFTSRYINHMIVFIAISHIISLKQKHLFFFGGGGGGGGGGIFFQKFTPRVFLSFRFFLSISIWCCLHEKSF